MIRYETLGLKLFLNAQYQTFKNFSNEASAIAV